MPVKAAMSSPIGIESTPSRRACCMAFTVHVLNSGTPRADSAMNSPT